MMQASTSRCPDAETLAAWVEGRLPESETAALIEHASECPECIAMIDLANETCHEEESPNAGRVAGPPLRWTSRLQTRPAFRWLAVAAVVVLAFGALVVIRLRNEDPLQALVAVAPRAARGTEARLSGGFAWAPYRGAMRANEAGPDTEQMKLVGAAAEALEEAARDASPEAQRAAGVAMVLIDRPEEGVARLQAEAKRAASDATAWSDLAAAQYAAAMAGRTALYPEALASADRALQLDPRLREALFNRALVLERLGLRGEARAAWQRYLDADPSSEWATEAREHLSRLGTATAAPPFDADRARLELAAAAGDEPVVRTLVGLHRERARAFAEAEYLGRWAAALQQGDANESGRWLNVSRSIGAALVQASGESLLRDAVQAIDAASPAQRSRIAEAHVGYRRGRIAYSRRELGAAERDLRLAAEQFAAAGSPMSLVARSYAAGARLAQNDVAQANRELTALAGEIDERRGYLSLAGQVRWELARCLIFDADWNGAARVLSAAEALFARAGEPANQAVIGAMLADVRGAAGRPDEAWSARARAFEMLAAAGRHDLLQNAVGSAATAALRGGRPEVARALVGVGESLARGASNDLLLADILVRKALLDGDANAAADATTVAMRIPDPALRARHLADADLAMAAALLGTNARRSRELASRALDTYVASNLTVLVAEPYLVRARASLQLGDTAAAWRDLDAGMAVVERHPMDVVGTGVLDAGNALFEEAMRLALDRKDVASVFALAERRRGIAAGAGALDELRARLEGSGTTVVTTIVLPRELVSVIVTGSGASASRRAIARDEVIALAAKDDDAALYQLLLAPAAAALADARALIVVPDALLERVPYAALRDPGTRRTLIERMPVAIAASASSLRTASANGARARITAIELPTATGSAALPEAQLELAEIGGLYRTVRRVSADARSMQEHASAADVLHIAGHTEGDASMGGEALAAEGGAISWSTIAAMRGMPPVVVLSACNTLRRPSDPDRRALSLGGAFVAAGAHDVIGTLAPIGDRDARSLFFALHEQLARGVSPSAALRHVQLAQQQRPGAAWRRLALLTDTIQRSTE